MKLSLRLALCLTGAALASGQINAQDIKFGLQGTIAYPTSDLGDKGLLDNSLGYGLGAHMVIGFPGGHAVIPRLDFSKQVNKGCYVGAGAGFSMAKFEMDLPGMNDSDTPNTVYGSVSAGYMFTPNMGAELRYTYAKYEPELFGTKPEIASPVINATFIYRF